MPDFIIVPHITQASELNNTQFSPTVCRFEKPLLTAGMNVKGSLKCAVSDMTAFYVKNVYYELTLYMDLWNAPVLF